MIDLSHIAEGLRGLAVEVDSLHADPANARKGHAVERIAASLRQYGQRKPIVVNRLQGNKVEAGNGTLSAARLLGWSHVAAVFVEDDAATATGFGIADNRTGDLSEWDLEALDSLLGSIDPDEIFTGFEAGELDDLLEEAGKGKKGDGLDAEPQIDRAEELRQEWGVELGQLWRLPPRTPGQEHRLICGDCTEAATVERVMGGKRAAIAITSPPYGVRKEYEVGGLAEWKQTVVGMLARTRDITEAMAINLGDVKVGPNSREIHSYGILIQLCEAAEFPLIGTRIWSKGAAWAGQGPYWLTGYRAVDEFEYIGLFGTIPHIDRTSADWRYRGIWEIPSVVSNKLHSAAFPIELPARLIELASDDGAIVYDPFLGSGTTLIAAENLSRQCRAVELSPGYVAVALQRYLDAFGIRGELVE